VGSAFSSAYNRFKKTWAKLSLSKGCIRYHGEVPHNELARYYREADAFVFASSCENLPIILLEAMAAGLPIACSNRGPMPEVLKDAGVYFDPESPEQIAQAMAKLMADSELRASCSAKAYEYASQYQWKRCADETFAFLSSVAKSALKR
jgi:glycosyltransferase involved in cell wall biosynthesis